MTEFDHKYDNSDEISLKVLLTNVKGYVKEIIRSWFLVGLMSLLGVAAFLYQHYAHKITYESNLKFVVEGQSGGGSGLGSLLGSLGMGSKVSKVNPYKVVEVAHGSELFLKVMGSKATSGKLIANEILEVYGLTEKWSESNSEFDKFYFDTLAMTYGEDILNQKAIKSIHKLVWGTDKSRASALTKIDFNDDTGLFYLESETLSEDLSMDLTETFYKEIKFFFEEEMWQSQIQLAAILKQKADSLQYARNYKVRELAEFENRNRSLVGKGLIAERSILTMEQMAINTAYGEVLKTREMTDINMKDKKPVFVAVDTPFRPLTPEVSSFFQKVVLGIAVGAFFAILFVIFRKIYRDAMAE